MIVKMSYIESRRAVRRFVATLDGVVFDSIQLSALLKRQGLVDITPEMCATILDGMERGGLIRRVYDGRRDGHAAYRLEVESE